MLPFRSQGEDLVHDVGAAFDHGPELLTVDSFGDGGGAVPHQPGDDLHWYFRVRQQRHEALPEDTDSPLSKLDGTS